LAARARCPIRRCLAYCCGNPHLLGNSRRPLLVCRAHGRNRSSGRRVCRILLRSCAAKPVAHVALQGYVVNLSTGKLIDRIGGFIQDSIELPDRQRYVFSTATDFDLYRNGKIIWRTRRLSWDGFRNVVVQGQILIGEAWMFDDTWHPFVVDLSSGTASGGSYNAAA